MNRWGVPPEEGWERGLGFQAGPGKRKGGDRPCGKAQSGNPASPRPCVGLGHSLCEDPVQRQAPAAKSPQPIGKAPGFAIRTRAPEDVRTELGESEEAAVPKGMACECPPKSPKGPVIHKPLFQRFSPKVPCAWYVIGSNRTPTKWVSSSIFIKSYIHVYLASGLSWFV